MCYFQYALKIQQVVLEIQSLWKKYFTNCDIKQISLKILIKFKYT